MLLIYPKRIHLVSVYNMDQELVVMVILADDTLSGESLLVQADSNHGSITVNGVLLSEIDILAANGR